MPTKPKLRFYAAIKDSLHVEKYVSYNLSPSERSIAAQWRFGILPLEIETGRFRNTKVEDRICSLCDSNEVESEVHFAFHCPRYDAYRVFAHVRQDGTDIDSLDDVAKCKLLFSSYQRKFAKYLLQIFKCHKDNLFNV